MTHNGRVATSSPRLSHGRPCHEHDKGLHATTLSRPPRRHQEHDDIAAGSTTRVTGRVLATYSTPQPQAQEGPPRRRFAESSMPFPQARRGPPRLVLAVLCVLHATATSTTRASTLSHRLVLHNAATIIHLSIGRARG